MYIVVTLLLCACVGLGASASRASPCTVKRAQDVRKPRFSGCVVYAECSRKKRLTEVPRLPSNVTCVELVKNKIRELKTSDFEELKNLRGMALSRNKIRELGRGTFKGLKALNVLLLDGNRIATIRPGAFKGLKALTHLNLEDNQLTNLDPGAFEGLHALKWLSLDGNKIIKLRPGVFAGLNLLQELTLWNNQITELDSEALEGLLILKALKLSGNSLKCNCVTAQTYRFLMKTRGSTLKIRGKCDRGTRLSELDPETICSKCGLPPLAQGDSCQNTVPGQTNAFQGEIPWNALLELDQNPDGQPSGMCGASLVKRNWLLTAAHCVHKNGKLRRPADIQVLLGLHNRTNMDASHVQRMQLSKILPHPNYNALKNENDLALLELSRDANITDYVLPVCLPRSSRGAKLVSNSSIGRVAAWAGTTSCHPTGTLQKACVRPLTRKECNALAHRSIPSSMMCSTQKDESQHVEDVGGGLAFRDLSTSRWVLGGVVSGELNVCVGCPRTALYMRVTGSVLRWIEEVTGF